MRYSRWSIYSPFGRSKRTKLFSYSNTFHQQLKFSTWKLIAFQKLSRLNFTVASSECNFKLNWSHFVEKSSVDFVRQVLKQDEYWTVQNLIAFLKLSLCQFEWKFSRGTHLTFNYHFITLENILPWKRTKKFLNSSKNYSLH